MLAERCDICHLCYLDDYSSFFTLFNNRILESPSITIDIFFSFGYSSADSPSEF